LNFSEFSYDVFAIAAWFRTIVILFHPRRSPMRVCNWVVNVCTVVVALLGLLGSAEAAIVFSQDFEGSPDFDSPPTPLVLAGPNAGFSNSVANGTFTVENTQAGFTGTKYLKYDDGASTPLLRSGTFANPLTGDFTVSFDYYEPFSNTGATVQTAFRLALTNGATTNGTTTNRAIEVNLAVGSAATAGTLDTIGGVFQSAAINADTLLHIDIIGTFGAGTSYPAGATYLAGSLLATTYDVYINGVLAADNAAFRSAQTQATELAFFATSANASRVQTALVDNIIVLSSVPEPSTYALGLLASLGLVAFRVRR
jgi:hypothetical protein